MAYDRTRTCLVCKVEFQASTKIPIRELENGSRGVYCNMKCRNVAKAGRKMSDEQRAKLSVANYERWKKIHGGSPSSEHRL